MRRFLLFAAAAAIVPIGSAPPLVASPPGGADIRLSDGRVAHAVPLPFGDYDGAIVGDVRFDASGTRAAFVAVFPGIAPAGAAPPIAARQAFAFDAARLRLTQLTSDGRASDVRFTSDGVRVLDAGAPTFVTLERAARGEIRGLRIVPIRSPLGNGFQVSSEKFGRFRVERVAGAYAIEQFGARRFRVEGIAPGGAFAFVGPFVVFIDGARHAPFSIARSGPMPGRPWSFSGSPYGDALTPVRPLGQAVLQGGYRRGTAYFPIRVGVDRGIAQTTDLVRFTYPKVPDFRYTSGDGLGAGDDGAPYFARPESGELTYWRAGGYARLRLHVPDAARDLQPLIATMRALDASNALYPPLRPESNALDAALVQWRLYPATPRTGERWIASHLGTLWSISPAGAFTRLAAPAPAFTLLGRTDDGRLWGAAPLLRRSAGPGLLESAAALWTSADGRAWRRFAALPADPGAVGLVDSSLMVASTKPWFGRPMIWVSAVERSGTVSASAPTGATFGGEQLFFADLASGAYLVMGAAPGFRLGAEQGALSALRLDQTTLFGGTAEGNAYVKDRIAPNDDASLATGEQLIPDAVAFARPSIDAIYALARAPHVQLVTNVALSGIDPKRVTLITPAREAAFEVKYAEAPYPIAEAVAGVSGDVALVHRSMRLGTLSGSASDETWRRTPDGRWRMVSAIRSRY